MKLKESGALVTIRERMVDCSYSEVADRCGMDRNNLRKYAIGEREPLVTRAIRIARALNCTVEDLYALDD